MYSQNLPKEVGVIFDDHRLFGQAFKEVLEYSQMFQSVHFYWIEKELLDFIQRYSRSKLCLFLDFYFKDSNALRLISEIRKIQPQAKIIMVTSADSPALIRKILSQKVDGLISKADGIEQIQASINSANKRSVYVSPTIQKIMITTDEGTAKAEFTARELEILALLANGTTTAEIADRLNLSLHTVMTHRKKIMAKIGAKTITQAIIFAIKCGLV